MMYFSKITLEPSMSLVGNLMELQRNKDYASHQLLWKLFSEEQERRFLYRQEMLENGLPVFWVLSQVEPQFVNGLFNVNTKVFAPYLTVGQKLAYKLRANPTVCDKESNKRHDVMMHAKYQAKMRGESSMAMQDLMQKAACEWLSDSNRLSRWGIDLDVEPNVSGYIQHRCVKSSGRVIQFSSVDYQGVLTVRDPERFLYQYSQGFGRSKSLGCGLMLIRRV